MTALRAFLRTWPAPGPRAGLCLLALLALPMARHWMEAGMTTHMALQFPLIAGAGFLLAPALPRRCAVRLQACNAYGMSGLLASALVLAVLMIPRVLDLALVDARIELAKWLALLVCGAALRLSWRAAGLLVQGFFLGNVLPMTSVVGYLYASSPVRVCNAYLLDDQERLGQVLVWASAGIALTWFAGLARTLAQRDENANADTPADAAAVAVGETPERNGVTTKP